MPATEWYRRRQGNERGGQLAIYNLQHEDEQNWDHQRSQLKLKSWSVKENPKWK